MTSVKQFWRFLIAVIILGLLLQTATVTFAVENLLGHWASSSINLLLDEKIISGDEHGNINPDDQITRAEFVKIVNRTFGYTKKSGVNFPDVNNNIWYYDEFRIAKNTGFILGDENGLAHPDADITRAEVAVILSRTLKLVASKSDSTFIDNEFIPSWALKSIIAMQENGFLNGYPDGTVRAENNLTRAEGFTLIANIITTGIFNPAAEEKSQASIIITPAPTPAPVKIIPNNLGYSGSSGGGGQGTAPPPTSPPGPIGGDMNPSIVVHTLFPSGKTINNAVDIEYTAKAGNNASISEIYYSVNGGAEEYIYLAGGDGITAKGSLGSGRVFLIPGENSIIFTVKDSANRTGTYTVTEKPCYEFGSPPVYDVSLTDALSDGSKTRYFTNRIVIFTKTGVKDAQVEAAVATIEGTIVGKVNVLGMYNIEVPINNENGLQALCDKLMVEYPELFEEALLDKFDKIDIEAVSNTKDPWWDDWNILRWYNHQWALSAIGVPAAWENYGGHFRNIKIGVVDNGFRSTHEDLNIPSENIYNLDLDNKNHGSHVIGTIGAIHNNNKGLAGVIDINRSSLYGYDAFDIEKEKHILWWTGRDYSASPAAVLTGLAWNVVNGAKVINFSLGAEGATGTNNAYSRTMYKLLAQGYDFVVVHSAGNSTEDARFTGAFAYVTETALRQRIITVGATDTNGNMASFSNYGSRVDVVAPGVRIYSSVASSDSAYESYDGTSMAAPHASGAAAMVWAANPGLSSIQVKEIIVNSANESGLMVTDNRRSVPEDERRVYHQIDVNAAVSMAIGTTPVKTTGRLTGQIIDAIEKDAQGDPVTISGARLSLYSGINDKPLTVALSDNDGQYTIDFIDTGRYYLEVAADGYIPEKLFIQIEAGVTTNIHRLRAVIESDENGTASGSIINAFTGTSVNNEITLAFRRGIDNPGDVVNTIAVTNGNYSVNLPAGNYTVTASGAGFITTSSYIYVVGGSIIGNQDVVISPAFSPGGEGSIRIVLTWGALPRDLDSHLTGPTPDGRRFHVYYYNKRYNYSSQLYANLDVDDTTSYGPETTTIYKMVDGRYEYYVQDYSNFPSTTSDYLRNSQAVIRIYSDKNELLRTFNVPTGGGASTIWHVFSFDVQSGKYVIVPVNSMSNIPTSPLSIGQNSSSVSSNPVYSIYSSEDLTAYYKGENITHEDNVDIEEEITEKPGIEISAELNVEDYPADIFEDEVDYFFDEAA